MPSSTIASMARIWSNGVKKVKKSQTDIQELDKTGKRTNKIYAGLVNCLLNKENVPKDVPKNWSILNKFQFALYLADTQHKLPFDQNDVLCKDVNLLIRLRDRLTHHKSEWITFSPGGQYEMDNEETKALVQELKARTFNNCKFDNPLTKGVRSGNILEPILGATCAMWGVNSSVRLVLDFSRRSHIELWSQEMIPNITKRLSSVAACE